MSGATLHNCCDCECLRFTFLARVRLPDGRTEYRQATLSHSADCFSQPPTAITPFDRQFAYTPTNQFSVDVDAPPVGDWEHVGWTIQYDDGVDAAGPGPLALEIHQGIGHNTRIIAEFAGTIEQPETDCSNLSLDVPGYLEITTPAEIDFDDMNNAAWPEDEKDVCGGFGGLFSKVAAYSEFVVQCDGMGNLGEVPLNLAKRIRPSEQAQDVVRYVFRNSVGDCIEAYLWTYWKAYSEEFSTFDHPYRPSGDAACAEVGPVYFKPFVTCIVPLRFVGGPANQVPDGGVNTEPARVLFTKTLALGSVYTEEELAILYRNIDETGPGSTNQLFVDTGETSFGPMWERFSAGIALRGYGPPCSPLRTFASLSGAKVSGVGAVGAFAEFYCGKPSLWTGFHVGGFGGPNCEFHSIDPDFPWYSSKCRLDANAGHYSGDIAGGMSSPDDGSDPVSFDLAVAIATEMDGPNDPAKCKCVTADTSQNGRVAVVTSDLYEHGDASIDEEPCVLDCFSGSSDESRNDIFPPKIRLILPKLIDLRWLNVPPDCVDNAAIAKLYERTSGKVHVMGTICTDTTHVTGDSLAPNKAITPFGTLYNVEGVSSHNISVWTAEYKFGDGSGCTETSRVFLDIGWVNNYSGGFGCGADSEERHILFTQCRIQNVSLGGNDAADQCDFYAINFGPEFNRGDFSGTELISTGILDNPWNWRRCNFHFDRFWNERLYGDHPNIPLDPDDARDCDFSMNPLRYRYSQAHKIYGGAVDEFCVDPDGVPCYYPALPGSSPTDPVPFANLEMCAYGANHWFDFKVEPWFSDPVDDRCVADQNDDFIRYDEVTP